MAKSYLGKISALVTANTSDFNRKLDESAQRTRSFAASVKSQINAAERAASKSLDGIYTSLQKVERALSAAGGRRLSLIDEREANKIRQLVSAAEEVYKPLERAAKASEKLGSDVRANFQPALIAAQKSAESLNRVIESGGTVGERSFQRIRRQVELTAEAIDRLSEVQSAVGGLATGRELRFSSPSVAAALEDAQREQQRLSARGAAGAAASADIVRRQRQAAEAVAAADSRLVAAELQRAQNRFAAPGDVAAARDSLADRVAQLSLVTAELRAQQDALDQQAAREKELVEQERKRAEAAREFAGFQDRIRQSVTGSPQTIEQAQQQFERLAATIGKLNSAGQGAVDPLVDELLRLFSAASRGDDVLSLVIKKLNQLRDAADSAAFLGNPTGPFGPPEPPGVGIFPAFPGNASGESTVALPPGFNGSSSAGLGDEIGSASRQLDSFRSQIVSLKSQVDSLPDGIRARFIPDVQELERTFRAAAAAPEQFAIGLQVIGEDLSRLSSGIAAAARANQAFGTTLGDAFEASQIRSYQAQLAVLQGLLINAGVNAGEAAEAVDRLGLELRDASSESGGLRANADAIAESFDFAASRVAAVTRTSRRSVDRSLRRAGDIGRAGVDNFSLATQQAAFAIDDFFSVTGGFEQRIRAVGNNLTQLGFIIGGTEGLFASLAIVIASQVAVALYKWANNGKTAEDATKSLNDALERQKSIVQELAEAFQSISDDIRTKGLSSQAAEANELSKRLTEIRDKQRKVREERVASTDTGVNSVRQEIAARERELSQATTASQQETLKNQIERLRIREQDRTRAALDTRLPDDVPGIARRSLSREVDAAFGKSSLSGAASLTASSVSPALGVLLTQLLNPLGNLTRNERFDRDNAAAIREFEARRAEARGTAGLFDPGRRARVARVDLDFATRQENAARGRAEGRGLFGPTLEARQAAESVLAFKNLRVRLENELAAAVDDFAAAVSEQSLRVAAKLGSGQASLDSAVGEAASATLSTSQRSRSLVQRLAVAQDELKKAQEKQDVDAASAAAARANAIARESSAILSLQASVASFADVLSRISGDLASTILGEVESTFSQARRQANESAAIAGRSPAALDEARFQGRRFRRIEDDTRAAQEQESEIRRQNNEATRRFENLARIGGLTTELQSLIRSRDSAQAEIDRAVLANRQVSPDVLDRRDASQRLLNRAFEASNAGREAAARTDRFDQEQAARRLREEEIRRGRELSRSPAEEAGRKLADDLRALTAAFQEEPGLRRDFAGLGADRQRVINEALRSTAPAIFNLADQAQNAILQGPSRAALQASDITTAQGAAELNRLLRGDDSARNQDLVELQKQSASLQELVSIARQTGAPPGVLNL